MYMLVINAASAQKTETAPKGGLAPYRRNDKGGG